MFVGSAPVGYDGTADWLEAIGKSCGVSAEARAAAQNAILPAIKGALSQKPITGRITVSGYEGSELLVARLLIESGADVPYVGTALPPAHNGRMRIALGSKRAECTCSIVPHSKTTLPP